MSTIAAPSASISASSTAPTPTPTPMRTPWLLSAAAHLGLFIVINVFAWLTVRAVAHQEQAFADQVAAKQQAAQAKARAEGHQAEVAAAKDRLAMELEDALTSDGPSAEADEVLAATDQDLASLFGDNAEPSDAQLNAAGIAALDASAHTAQEMLKRELIAEVRSYVRTQVAPELKDRIERELEAQAGPEVEHGLAAAAQEDANRSHHAVDQARARALATAGKQAFDPALRARIEARVRQQAIPQAAQKIAAAVQDQLDKAGVPSAEFTKDLGNDISNALDDALAGTVSTEAAYKSTEAKLGQAPTAAAAGAELTAAALELAKLAGQQETLRRTSPDAGDKERALSTAMADAEARARAALTTARAAASDTHAVDHATDALSTRHASLAASAAAQAATAGDRSAADGHMQEATQALHDDAASLGAVAKQLADAPAGDAQAGAALNAAMGAKVAAKLTGALGAADRAVDASAAALAPNGVLSDVAKLARFQALTATIAQARKNAAEGRAPGGPGLTPAGGIAGRQGRHALGHMSFNRSVYEAFVKDLRNRTHPGNAYEAVSAVVGLDSVAAPAHDPEPLAVWYEPIPPKTASAEKRTLVQPPFKSAAFGAAALNERPLAIDGDLSDWGPLTNPLICRWRSNDAQNQVAESQGVPVYVRWSNQGLYFAYQVAQPNPIHPNSETPYEGDCMEVWIDCQNSRLELMDKSKYTHQFCFDPFGYRGDPNCTFVEIGRGQRGLEMFQAYPDKTGKRGRAAARKVPGGYVVEAFLARETLARPVLVPGEYLALNISINRGPVDQELQWSASKAVQSWNRPDTWGDVLLLGSDASVRALGSDGQDCARVVAGQPLTVEVTDRDMNMDPAMEERVLAEVTPEGGDPVLMVLRETGPDTGIFRGSVNTALWLERPAANTVGVRPGSTIEVGYDDPRGAYGESHRHVGITLPVATPVVRMGAAPASPAAAQPR